MKGLRVLSVSCERLIKLLRMIPQQRAEERWPGGVAWVSSVSVCLISICGDWRPGPGGGERADSPGAVYITSASARMGGR